MPPTTPGPAVQGFVNLFCQAIGDVCSQAFASAWTVAIDSANEPSSPETPLVCFEAALSGGLNGNLAIQLRGTDALFLAQKILSEPLDASAKPKREHKEAIEKILHHVAGLVTTGLQSTFGEIKCDFGTAAPPAWEGLTVTLLASGSPANTLPLRLCLSSELQSSLSAAPAAASQGQTRAQGGSATEPNFDLLLGVNLNLTLRFGQCTMSLREILDMNSGSVVELDREVNKPADLLLGDKLIARGEVVIVDGNYGIRVTEVSDVRHRLGTI